MKTGKKGERAKLNNETSSSEIEMEKKGPKYN